MDEFDIRFSIILERLNNLQLKQQNETFGQPEREEIHCSGESDSGWKTGQVSARIRGVELGEQRRTAWRGSVNSYTI